MTDFEAALFLVENADAQISILPQGLLWGRFYLSVSEEYEKKYYLLIKQVERSIISNENFQSLLLASRQKSNQRNELSFKKFNEKKKEDARRKKLFAESKDQLANSYEARQKYVAILDRILND